MSASARPLPILGADFLRAHVRFTDLIEPVASAFKETSLGLAENGLIVTFPADSRDAGDVYVKTGVLRGHSVFVVKVSPWFARNVETGQSQGGFLAVFDSSNGRTLAILDEQHFLSDIRTAAAGAVAARILCPHEIHRAAVLGSGVQAYWQVLALHHERPFEQLTIWARDPKKANCLRERLHALLDRVSITVGRDLQETVHEADVILTATLARDPLVRGEWLRPGQHITAIGADDATKCELHASVLHRARVFVDDTGTAVRNGDVYHAIQAGGYCAEMLAGSIGEVLSGRKVGRTTPEEITLAKFVGIGAQDLVAAEVALAMLNLSSTDEKRSIGADPRNHYFPGSIRLPQ